jgi:O-antigen/teichoic acid export membrane protein
VPGVLGKVLAIAAGIVVMAAAFVFSILVFAVIAVAGLLLWAYLWWKTRELRKHLRERPPGGHTIEGVVIREVDIEAEREPERDRKRTPGA